jgi:hypothetical protein
MLPKVVSLIAIVLLLLWMFFCLCGGLPLLFLKHDVTLDGTFIRGFFDVHYLGLVAIAVIGALSSAFADRVVIAVALAVIGLIGFSARRVVVFGMDRLRATMNATNAQDISAFRRLHASAVILNSLLLISFIAVLSHSAATLQNM